jgi:hypothetical protein
MGAMRLVAGLSNGIAPMGRSYGREKRGSEYFFAP